MNTWHTCRMAFQEVRNKAHPYRWPTDPGSTWGASSPCIPGGNCNQSECWGCRWFVLLGSISRWLIERNYLLWTNLINHPGTPPPTASPSSGQADTFPLPLSSEVEPTPHCPSPKGVTSETPQDCAINSFTLVPPAGSVTSFISLTQSYTLLLSETHFSNFRN